MCVRDDAAEPCAGAASRVENPHRRPAFGLQRAQLRVEMRPDAFVGIGMQTGKREELARVAVGIGDIVGSGAVVGAFGAYRRQGKLIGSAPVGAMHDLNLVNERGLRPRRTIWTAGV